MKLGDYVEVTNGDFAGKQGCVTAIESNNMVRIDDKYWFVAEDVKPIAPIVEVKYFDKRCKLEQNGDWIDLKAAKDFHYHAGDALMIPLGVAMKLPKGYEAHMLPRSSTFKRYGIIMTNSMGIIDEAYCGDDDQWHFPAWALREGRIKVGSRIAQFRVVKHQPALHFAETSRLGYKNRGGFGSTGK